MPQISTVQHTSRATLSGRSTERPSTQQWLMGKSTWHPTSRKRLPAWNGMGLLRVGTGENSFNRTKVGTSIFSVKIVAMLPGQPYLMTLWWNITWHWLIWETNDSAQHSTTQPNYITQWLHESIFKHKMGSIWNDIKYCWDAYVLSCFFSKACHVFFFKIWLFYKRIPHNFVFFPAYSSSVCNSVLELCTHCLYFRHFKNGKNVLEI